MGTLYRQAIIQFISNKLCFSVPLLRVNIRILEEPRRACLEINEFLGYEKVENDPGLYNQSGGLTLFTG